MAHLRRGARDAVTSGASWLVERAQLDAAHESSPAASWLSRSNVLELVSAIA
jgi:hypothetical protein